MCLVSIANKGDTPVGTIFTVPPRCTQIAFLGRSEHLVGLALQNGVRTASGYDFGLSWLQFVKISSIFHVYARVDHDALLIATKSTKYLFALGLVSVPGSRAARRVDPSISLRS